MEFSHKKKGFFFLFTPKNPWDLTVPTEERQVKAAWELMRGAYQHSSRAWATLTQHRGKQSAQLLVTGTGQIKRYLPFSCWFPLQPILRVCAEGLLEFILRKNVNRGRERWIHNVVTATAEMKSKGEKSVSRTGIHRPICVIPFFGKTKVTLFQMVPYAVCKDVHMDWYNRSGKQV